VHDRANVRAHGKQAETRQDASLYSFQQAQHECFVAKHTVCMPFQLPSLQLASTPHQQVCDLAAIWWPSVHITISVGTLLQPVALRNKLDTDDFRNYITSGFIRSPVPAPQRMGAIIRREITTDVMAPLLKHQQPQPQPQPRQQQRQKRARESDGDGGEAHVKQTRIRVIRAARRFSEELANLHFLVASEASARRARRAQRARHRTSTSAPQGTRLELAVI
jgi:hypothetical protein